MSQFYGTVLTEEHTCHDNFGNQLSPHELNLSGKTVEKITGSMRRN